MIVVAFASCENTYESQHTIGIQLRDMLFHCFHIESDSYTFSKTKEGKPFAVGAPFHFSISHSKTLCCCAVSSDTPLSENTMSYLSDDLQIDAALQNMPLWKWRKNMLLFPSISGEIGLDLEKVDFDADLPRLKKITKRYLHNAVSPSNAADFFKSWTQQEAYGKYTGQGFLARPEPGVSLYSFRVAQKNDTYFLSLACTPKADPSL